MMLVLGASGACSSEDGGVPADGLPPLQGPDDPLSWSVDPVYRIGGAEAPEWAAFTEVTDVGFDASGRLYILDGPGRQVTVVDPSGEPSGTIGTPGEGPGELRFPGGLVVHPDGTVTVVDAGHGGFVVYGPAGEVLRNVGVDVEGVGLPPGLLSLGPDGGIYGTGELRPSASGLATGPPGGRDAVRFTDAVGGTPRVIYSGWRPPMPDTRELTPEETGGLRVRLPPVLGFHPELHLAPLPGGRLAVVDSFAYRVRIVAADGTVLEDIQRPIEPVPVTAGLREAARSIQREALEASRPRRVVSDRAGRTAAAPTGPMARLEEARIDAMGFHPRVPVVARLGADPLGRIWVERTGSEPGRPGPTDLLTPEGRYLGTLPADGLRLPDAFGPEGLAAWVETDALGAAVVSVGRIREEG